MERFSCKMAIAPTASISIICGGTSACIEPIPPTSIRTRRCRAASRSAIPISKKLLSDKSKNSDSGVELDPGEGRLSVQHLDFLSQDEKDCYKTSFEIDQRWLLELSADRTPFIDQAQSLNLFIPADVEKVGSADAPLSARGNSASSRSIISARRSCSARASRAGSRPTTPPKLRSDRGQTTDYDECLACQ
jgi:ribonucleoside-diphosphate reductase alpha chain